MADTDIQYTTQCDDQNGAKHSKSQSNTTFSFTIRNTPQCSGDHDSHLDYNGHTHVHIADFAVSGDKLTLRFRWRSRSREEIFISPMAYVLEENIDRVNFETSFVLGVPPLGRERSWLLEGGSPGFSLTVKVKRK